MSSIDGNDPMLDNSLNDVEIKRNAALVAIKKLLTNSKFNECQKLLGNGGEWLSSFELAVATIIEKNIYISPKDYRTIYLGFEAIGQKDHELLEDLKLFVRRKFNSKERRLLAFATWHTNVELSLILIFLVGAVLYAIFD